MSLDHPIAEVAEQFGRLTSQFEPGTSFYAQVVQEPRKKVQNAQTRDDLELLVNELKTKLGPHLTDDQMDQFDRILQSMSEVGTGWSVEAFKEGYQRGTGEQLPDDGSAAGRAINSDRKDA